MRFRLGLFIFGSSSMHLSKWHYGAGFQYDY
ncbi:MAG: hypothetical protein ACJA1P_002386, partial [Maribacter sp.]